MIPVKKLNGRKVITNDAKNVGEVDGAYVETDKWNITHLIIELNDPAIELFGYKKPTFLGSVNVCIPISAVEVIGDVITLNKAFKDLPELSIKKCE
jgi:sporulation protein YlmC with PRC-barrel domain